MKPVSNAPFIVVVIVLLSLQSVQGEPQANQDARIWERYATQTYGKLNARADGDLTPVFRSLGGFGELHEYFDKDSNPKKFETYCQLIVQALVNTKERDVAAGMFADVLLALTPPHVVLIAVAPHVGKGGQLEGILEGQYSAVGKRIQGQSRHGELACPGFIEYVRYLKAGKLRGLNNVNATVIVDHMFQIDPQEAFVSLLSADYGFNRYARGNCYLLCKDDTESVRDLQIAHADIADYLSRIRYSFPTRDGQAAAVATRLAQLTDHKKWWVRLYVARLITTERALRDDELLSKLNNDQNEFVKAAMKHLAEEKSQGR